VIICKAATSYHLRNIVVNINMSISIKHQVTTHPSTTRPIKSSPIQSIPSQNQIKPQLQNKPQSQHHRNPQNPKRPQTPGTISISLRSKSIPRLRSRSPILTLTSNSLLIIPSSSNSVSSTRLGPRKNSPTRRRGNSPANITQRGGTIVWEIAWLVELVCVFEAEVLAGCVIQF
jgi:hypothetical protein